MVARWEEMRREPSLGEQDPQRHFWLWAHTTEVGAGSPYRAERERARASRSIRSAARQRWARPTMTLTQCSSSVLDMDAGMEILSVSPNSWASTVLRRLWLRTTSTRIWDAG